jgi:4-hydroxy-3-methylbut-2-enyl diphosphate reductase
VHLKDFAERFDKIIFVSGKKSSNGKVLFDVCKDVNPETYFISSKDELQKAWFNENDTVGICGATSTPQWQMDEVKETILAW